MLSAQPGVPPIGGHAQSKEVQSYGLTELYFSIIQRKVLSPNDCADLAAVEERLLAYEALYNHTARPFTWTFTRDDLEHRLAQLDHTAATLAPAA